MELQPVTADGASANRQDGARLDISANGVWGGRFEKTYFDARVLNPTNLKHGPLGMYRAEKKRTYEQQVREGKHSSFTPLVLSSCGGMGNEATTFFKRLG